MVFKKNVLSKVRRHLVMQFRKAVSGFMEGFWWPPVALLMGAIYWFSIANTIPIPTEQTVEKFGLYGDSFGRLTSLFTALGFGGLVITLLLQQRQIRMHEESAKRQQQKEDKNRYEDILFQLMEIYRQTLSEVRVGEETGRNVLRQALNRVDACILEDGVHSMSRDLHSKCDSGALTDNDLERIDYLHFRNFKIVSVEITPQTRLVDTLEVLMEHMVRGAPDHLLINAYKNLVFAQFTFVECRYFFLVALAYPNRARLRELLAKSGFLDRISRSQTHKLHRDMYKKYWGQTIEQRELPDSIPMSQGQIKRAMRAHRAAGGVSKAKYAPWGTRTSQKELKTVKSSGKDDSNFA